MLSKQQRVFVSSTVKDLANYRCAAMQVITWAGLEPELVGPLTGFTESQVVDACQQLVRTCGLCILIVGRRRGGMISHHSFTSHEIQAADNNATSVISFLVHSDASAIENSDDEITIDEMTWVANFRQQQRSGRSQRDVIEVPNVETFSAYLNLRLHEFKQLQSS